MSLLKLKRRGYWQILPHTWLQRSALIRRHRDRFRSDPCRCSHTLNVALDLLWRRLRSPSQLTRGNWLEQIILARLSLHIVRAVLLFMTTLIGTIPFQRTFSKSFLTEARYRAIKVIRAKRQEFGESHVSCSILSKFLLGE